VWIKLRSCRTVPISKTPILPPEKGPTSYTRKQLTSKILNLTAWKWNEGIAFEKIKDALTQKISDDANVISEIKAVSQVNAFVSIRLVVGR
jgi:hypothetical protein